MQEVSFIGFASNWQSVLVFFSISPGFQALSGFQEYGHPTTHIVQNHLDWAIWGMGADASRCIVVYCSVLSTLLPSIQVSLWEASNLSLQDWAEVRDHSFQVGPYPAYKALGY